MLLWLLLNIFYWSYLFYPISYFHWCVLLSNILFILVLLLFYLVVIISFFGSIFSFFASFSGNQLYIQAIPKVGTSAIGSLLKPLISTHSRNILWCSTLTNILEITQHLFRVISNNSADVHSIYHYAASRLRDEYIKWV